MSKRLYEQSDIQALADVIKAKASATGTYTIQQLKTVAENIKSVFVTQEKTISPTESIQYATPDDGKDGLSKVTINAISTTYVGSGITKNPTPTVSGATITIPSGYYSSQTTKSVSLGTAGVPSATKGSVSNHQISITPTVTNTTGYITGGTKNGTAITVSASELVSGSETKYDNGTYDVTNIASLIVNIPLTKYHVVSSKPSSASGYNNGDLILVKG